jgi:hypothetical protein
VDRSYVHFVWVGFPVEFGRDNAGGHGRDSNLLGGANRVHFIVGELDLPRVHVVDQFVAVHEVDANDVVVQFVYDIHWVREFLSFDPEAHFIDPYGIHGISGCGDAALRVGDFLGFLVSESGVERSAVHAGDGCPSVE